MRGRSPCFDEREFTKFPELTNLHSGTTLPRRMRRLAAFLLLGLAVAACGPGTTAARASPRPATGAGAVTPTPTFFKPRPSAPAGPGSGPLAVMLAAAQGGAPQWTIALVGTDGKTVASTHTSAPPLITTGGGGGGAVATFLPLVSASNTSLYYLDGGNVMALRRDGSTAKVTTVPSGPNLHVGFAVSLDDKQIAYSVLDYAQQPVTEGLFLDPIPAAGGHGALFNTTGPDYGWPVGWHGHQLVLAHGPAFVQNTALNPYNAFNGYRVVDPLTADRLSPPLQFNDCQFSGPLTAAGSACFSGTETRIVNYDALINPRATAQVAWAAVSPDGSSVAACCGAGGGYETLGFPGAAGDIPIQPAAQYGGGWLDATHFLADGDLTTPPRIWDSRTNKVVSATGVLGHFAAVVPGGFGDSPWGEADPIAAVKAMVEPGPTACSPKAGPPHWSRAFGCAVTGRLQTRLQTVSIPANPACRCQNLLDVAYSTDNAAPTAHVDATFGGSYTITWSVVQEGGRWFADDSWCRGSSATATSIYKDPLGPCSSG